MTTKKCSDLNCLNCSLDTTGKEKCFICKGGFELVRTAEGSSCIPGNGCMLKQGGLCELCRFGYYASGNNTCIANLNEAVTLNRVIAAGVWILTAFVALI